MTDNEVAEGRAPITVESTTVAPSVNDNRDIGPTRPLPLCPLCSNQLMTLSDRCQSCFGDLRLLMRVVQLGDQYFNHAVVAARSGRWWEAAEHLAVTLALREDDVEALILLGKVRKRGKQHDLARAAWQEALRHAPDRDDIPRPVDRASRPTGRRSKKTPP